MSRSACVIFLHVFRLEGVVLCEGGSLVCGKIASICLKYTKPVQQVGATFTEYKNPHYNFSRVFGGVTFCSCFTNLAQLHK